MKALMMRSYPLALGLGLLFVSGSNAQDSEVEHLYPFAHFAAIPASTHPATIKFESVKATKVFTQLKSTMHPRYCEEFQFSEDPGGSMFCPYTQEESPAPAYAVTYSYTGQPIPSDEYGNTHFTFQVYFHPKELPPAVLRALAGKMNRAELATYFKWTTRRLLVRATVIDEANSSFCAGYYGVDGNWMHNDPNCYDRVRFKKVTRPSDYIAIHVEPVSPGPQQASASAREAHSSDLSVPDNRR